MRYRSRQVVCAVVVAVGMSAVSAAGAGVPITELTGIVVDNDQAETTGNWKRSTQVRPFVGGDYMTAPGGSDAEARFSLAVPQAGEYQVLMAYTASGNRADRVAITIHAANGEQVVRVNQKQTPSGPGPFQALGQFRFEAGTARVTISTAETSGAVIVDAVQLLTAEQFKTASAVAKPAEPAVVQKPPKPEPKTVSPAPASNFVPRPADRPLVKLQPTQLDELLEKHADDIKDARVATDEQFLRRVTLDIVGRQPTERELDDFLAAPADTRRAAVVSGLLDSSDYGRNWANYWSDVIRFRVQEPELTFLNYETFQNWLAEQFNQGVTWDRIAHGLLTAKGKIADNPAATFIGFHQADKSRLPTETTRIFLGVQIQCAECHDHKFIDMPRKTFHEFAAFFTRTQAKLPHNDSDQIEVLSKPAGEHKMPGGKGEMQPIAFGSLSVEFGAADEARRKELADWIVSPGNPWFAKAFVNRIWSRLMGRGFCEPVDEIGLGADPTLPEVHTALADHFAATGFDARDVIRLIASTRAYQRGPLAGRLRGDEVFDSLATAIELPNAKGKIGKTTGAFRFPIPPKSTRDLTHDAFAFDPSLPKDAVVRGLPQAMFLMNNEQVQQQIKASPEAATALAKLLAEERDDTAAITRLFRKVFARHPSDRERKIAEEHLASLKDRSVAFEDLLWSLLNSAEFTTRP